MLENSVKTRTSQNIQKNTHCNASDSDVGSSAAQFGCLRDHCDSVVVWSRFEVDVRTVRWRDRTPKVVSYIERDDEAAVEPDGGLE